MAGRFNAAALGFYKKAFDLFALSASQLTAPLDNVALAALSRLNQDPARFRRYLANSLGMIAFVGLAVSADLTLVGRDVVRLLLGAQWAESGRIFQLFGPGIGVMLLCSTVGWIHLSIGKPGRWLRWTVVEFVVTASLFVIALPWGPKGIAAAWSVSYSCARDSRLLVCRATNRIWRFILDSRCLAVCRRVAARGRCNSRHLPRHAYLGFFGRSWGCAGDNHHYFIGICQFYLGAVILLHWGFAPLRQLAGLLRDVVPRRIATNPAAEPVEEYK